MSSILYIPNPPIIFLVIFALGKRIMSNQKGCGKKVATEKAVWIGSGEVAYPSAKRTMDDDVVVTISIELEASDARTSVSINPDDMM